MHFSVKLAEAAHKPGSVPGAGYPTPGDDHSSRAAVADGLQQPTRKHGRAVLDASLLGLAPGGVYLASDVTAGPGELLPHPFTLTRLGGRTSLCGTFPGVTPAGRYPAPCPVEPGLSSPCEQAAAIWSTSAKPFGFVKSPSAALHKFFVTATYLPVRLIPQALCALHLELFTMPKLYHYYPLATSWDSTSIRWQWGQVMSSSPRNSML